MTEIIHSNIHGSVKTITEGSFLFIPLYHKWLLYSVLYALIRSVLSLAMPSLDEAKKNDSTLHSTADSDSEWHDSDSSPDSPELTSASPDDHIVDASPIMIVQPFMDQGLRMTKH